MVAKNDITGDSIQTRGASEKYRNNYDLIFRKNKVEDNTGVSSNEYQDVLSTEDCMEYDAPVTRYNQETQEVLKYK